MTCGQCGAASLVDAKFCHMCGAGLPRACGSCAAVLPDGARFCPMCGTAASGTASPPSVTQKAEPAPTAPTSSNAERRQMTILFCDLVGSTPISEVLDPEELRDLLSAYRRICAEAVEHMGGTVTKLVGDGLDAHFGYPVDYEDSAQRAVRAALAIVAAVPRLQKDFPNLSLPIEARIGINTGLVVVGDVGDGSLREKQSVIGDTPNVAARLQGEAQPGQVVIGQPTWRLVERDFVFEPLGLLPLKGVAEPMNCYVVIAETTEQQRADRQETSQRTMLIGRDGELAILRQNWKRAKGGDGQTVLLTGEAGIGKSRIVDTLVNELRTDPDMAELRLYSSSVHASTAFRPFIREIVTRAGFGEGPGGDDQLAKLEQLLDDVGLDRDEYLPPLATTLNVDLKGGYNSPTDASLIKSRFQTAFAALIDAIAGDKTLLLLVEDLHWADPSTLEFLNQWITETAQRRCLMVLTFRPSFEHSWRDESHLSTLNLNRLSRVESREIIEQVARKSLPDEVTATIIQRTDGVPLFLEELTKMVLESGLLEETETEFRLTGPLPPLAIPDSLQNSLMARLDRLARVKEIAQLAATIGRRFSHKLLARVSGVADGELNTALDQLVDAELLQRFGFAPNVNYEFKHALVQDAAYSSMLKSTRQRVHNRIGSALAADPKAVDREPEIIAQHYLKGGAPAQAVPFSFAAGQHALAASAHREAVDHFTDALDHIDDLPSGAQRDRMELDIRMTYGVPLQTMRGYAHPSVRQNYDQVEQLAKALGVVTELMPLYYGMSRYHMLSAEYDKALIGGDKLLTAADTAGDAIFNAAGQRILGSIMFYTGKLDAARGHLLSVLDNTLLEDDYSTARQVDVVDFRVAANAYMGWLNFAQGRPNEARVYADAAIEVAEGLTHKFSSAFAICFACWTYEFCGDRDKARDLATTGLAMSREHGFNFWIGWTEVVVAATGGDLPKGLTAAEYARQGLRDWEEVGSRLGLTYLLSLTVRLLIKEGDMAGAEEILSQAEAFIDETDEQFWAPEILRLKGVMRQQSHPKSAAGLFRRAITEADAMDARLLALRATISLAQTSGWEDEGRRQIRERLIGFAADEACEDLQIARDLLRNTGELTA